MSVSCPGTWSWSRNGFFEGASPVRILIVASSLGMGGAERAAANAARILARAHRVKVFTFHRKVDYDPGTTVEGLDLSYDIDVPLAGKFSRFLVKIGGLRRAIADHGADLVISFGDGASLICLANKLAGGKPMVFTNTQAPPTKVYQGAIRPFYLNLIRSLFPHADGSIALSSGVREELIREFALRPERVTVIYNSLDLAAIRELADQGLDELAQSIQEIPCILTAGRLAPEKNQALLIRAFRRVRDRMRARLVIVGNGPLEGSLRQLVCGLGLEGDVVFAGWQANPFRLMKRARLFVLSSDYEGFGNVLAEAMAVACPVVATDCGGPAELLQQGACGILVPVGDETALAAAMARVLEDRDLRSRLAGKAATRAEDFSLSSIAGGYQELLSSLGWREPIPARAA
jgi:glycosyltransferase involved in cell wall biosynthesis